MPILAGAFAMALIQDRSGEPALRALFEKFGSKNPIHALVVVYECDANLRPRDTVGVYEVWRKSEREFRIEYAGQWGDAARWIANGKYLLFDPMEVSEPAELFDLQNGGVSSQRTLDFGGEHGRLLFSLMDGLSRLNEVAEPSADVRVTSDGTINFRNKTRGWVRIKATASDAFVAWYPIQNDPSQGFICEEATDFGKPGRLPKHWYDPLTKSHPFADRRKRDQFER